MNSKTAGIVLKKFSFPEEKKTKICFFKILKNVIESGQI
jgi:hypothetical protein